MGSASLPIVYSELPQTRHDAPTFCGCMIDIFV